MRISDWSSDVFSSDLSSPNIISAYSARTCPRGSSASDAAAPSSPPPRWGRQRDLRACALVAAEGVRSRHEADSTRWRNGAESVAACRYDRCRAQSLGRSEEHTSELQSLMRISYAV